MTGEVREAIEICEAENQKICSDLVEEIGAGTGDGRDVGAECQLSKARGGNLELKKK